MSIIIFFFAIVRASKIDDRLGHAQQIGNACSRFALAAAFLPEERTLSVALQTRVQLGWLKRPASTPHGRAHCYVRRRVFEIKPILGKSVPASYPILWW
jgi:hypothetical protein